MTGTIDRFTDEDILLGGGERLETINYSPKCGVETTFPSQAPSQHNGRINLADRPPLTRQINEIIQQFNASVDKIQSRSHSPRSCSPPPEPLYSSNTQSPTTIRRYMIVDGEKKDLTEEEYSELINGSRCVPSHNGRSPEPTKIGDRSPVNHPDRHSHFNQFDAQTSNWMASKSPEDLKDQPSGQPNINVQTVNQNLGRSKQLCAPKEDQKLIGERQKEKEQRRMERLGRLKSNVGQCSEGRQLVKSNEKTAPQRLECIEAPDYSWLNKHRMAVETRQQCRKFISSVERREGSKEAAEGGRWMDRVQKKHSQGIVCEIPSFFIQPVYRQLDKELKNHVKQGQTNRSRVTKNKPKPLKFTN